MYRVSKFRVLPVTVLFAFWPGVIGLSLTT